MHNDRGDHQVRSAGLSVVAGLCLFIIGAVVPYWDGGLSGQQPPPPPFAARRLINLPTEYLFSVHFWRTDTFWRIVVWLAVFAAILIASRVMTRRDITARAGAGFLIIQGAIFLLIYFETAAPLWHADISWGEPLALLWPLGGLMISVSGFIALRAGGTSRGPRALGGSRALATGLLLGAGLIVAGHLLPWHSRQTIPFIWTEWRYFIARHSYLAVLLLGVVVFGAVSASIQLFRTRSVTPAVLGAASAGALWILSRALPIPIQYAFNPYFATRAGIYFALVGALLVGAATLYLWRGSARGETS